MSTTGRRTITRIAMLLAAGALASSCGQAPDVPGQQGGESSASKAGLKLGLLLPYTGQYSWVGENVEEVARLIVDEANANGGVGGQKLTLVRGDTEGTVDAGVLAARKLANTDQVLSFIGPTSLSFTGVRQVIVDTGTPMVTPTAGTAELDRAGTELFHRTVPSDALGGRAIALAVSDPAQYLGGGSYDNVVLMVGDAPALVSFQKPIEDAMSDYGVSLADTLRYTVGKEAYRSEVASAMSHDPDLIVLIGEPADSAKIMQQAQQSGYTGGWFVTQDQTTSDYIELAGAELVEGVFGLEEAEASTAGALREEFEKQLGHPADIFQTNAYDAVNVAILAMHAAHADGEEVTRQSIEQHIDPVANPEPGDVVVTSLAEGAKAIEQGKGIDYQGLSGPVDFDKYGNITSPFAVKQVQGGKFSTVATIPAEALQ